MRAPPRLRLPLGRIASTTPFQREKLLDSQERIFVEDFHAEYLGCGHGAVFVGTGNRDVEGQDLIGVPRISNSLRPPTSETVRLSSASTDLSLCATRRADSRAPCIHPVQREWYSPAEWI